MPHDRLGRKINVGDVILARPYNQHVPTEEEQYYVGSVVEMHSSEQSCTGQMLYLKTHLDKRVDSCCQSMVMMDYFGAEDATLIKRVDGTTMLPTIGVDMAAEGADQTVETTHELS